MYARVLKLCTVMVPTKVRMCTEVMCSNGTNKVPMCTEVMYSNGTNKSMHVY